MYVYAYRQTYMYICVCMHLKIYLYIYIYEFIDTHIYKIYVNTMKLTTILFTKSCYHAIDLSYGGNLRNSKCEIKLSDNDHCACRHRGSGWKHLV